MPPRSRRASSSASRRRRSGTATSRTSSRASSTVTACTGRTSRRTGTGSTRTSCSSTPTPRLSAGDLKWDDALFGYQSATRRHDLALDERDSAAFAPLGGRRRYRHSRGATTARRDAVAQDLHLRGPRQGLHQANAERAREAARHLCRPRLRGRDSAPAGSGGHGRRAACRCITTSTTGSWWRRA